MNRTDFRYHSTPTGFTLLYKDKVIGYVSVKYRHKPLHGKIDHEWDKAYYKQVALEEINRLLVGAGRDTFVKSIQKVG